MDMNWLMVTFLTILQGTWQYDGYIYEGQRHPLPNPHLYLTFTFSENGRSRLYWSRQNEPGFCEREASYSIEEQHLFQTVVWVNPDNLPECQQDPDMQLGHESITLFQIMDQELHFYFHLNHDVFIYVLKRIPPTIQDQSTGSGSLPVTNP